MRDDRGEVHRRRKVERTRTPSRTRFGERSNRRGVQHRSAARGGRGPFVPRGGEGEEGGDVGEEGYRDGVVAD